MVGLGDRIKEAFDYKKLVDELRQSLSAQKDSLEEIRDLMKEQNELLRQRLQPEAQSVQIASPDAEVQ